MNIEVKSISPLEAKRILTRNTHNRNLIQGHVDFLSRQMSSGVWKFNGDSIRLDGDRLIDGQHRLEACARAGVPFKTILINGIESDAFDTIDTGRVRNGGDTLSVVGEKSVSLLSATLTFLINHREGSHKTHRRRITNSEIRRELELNPEVRRSVGIVASSGSRLMASSRMAGLHYLFSKVDKDMADAFVDKIEKGIGSNFGDPSYMLREKLIASKMSKSSMPRDYWPALAIKVWNAEFKGESPKMLRYLEIEKFPKIEGLDAGKSTATT